MEWDLSNKLMFIYRTYFKSLAEYCAAKGPEAVSTLNLLVNTAKEEIIDDIFLLSDALETDDDEIVSFLDGLPEGEPSFPAVCGMIYAAGNHVLNDEGDNRYTCSGDLNIPYTIMLTMFVKAFIRPEAERESCLSFTGMWEVDTTPYEEVFFEIDSLDTNWRFGL